MSGMDISLDLQDRVSMATLERGVISNLWQSLEMMLACGVRGVEHAIRAMQEFLPHIEDLELNELPRLAQLHMGSAANLMKALRLLTPSAFTGDSDRPNEAMFLRLDGAQLDLVTMLVELQLFHMTRASALVAAAKERLRGRRRSATSSGKGCHDDPVGKHAA